MVRPNTTLTLVEDINGLGASKAGRLLRVIRRDMDLKDEIFRRRVENERVLSLSYSHDDPATLGGDQDWKLVRENAFNLPYRWVRWFESQATSKKLVVKINRDAGAGQMKGGPGDETTHATVARALGRVAHEAGFRREMNAVIGEVAPRGTSVMRIGYHEQAVSGEEAHEAGKDARTILVDVLQRGDLLAKAGQDHAQIAHDLGEMAEDETVQRVIGQQGVQDLLARIASHIDAGLRDEVYEGPTESVRDIRRKLWLRKLRVGEDVGWAPWVYDTEDTTLWWERHVWTVADVKKSDLFTAKFKREVKGYDGRNISGLTRGGRTASTDSMGADGRQAQSEDILSEDERSVEWFEVWFRRPDMRAGGIRKMVSAETHEDFIGRTDENPYVDETGKGLIQGFYPYYDFTPIMSSLTVPARTAGIPPIGVAMPQFFKMAEYNRLRQEAALKGATRIHQLHPGMKDAKRVLDAINNGEIGYAFISPQGMVEPTTGKMIDAVNTYSFTGTDPEIDRQSQQEKSDAIQLLGMPPAVLQGTGTAPTLGQDKIGVAAGERESGALLAYFEERFADVLCGLRGLMRFNYDTDEYERLLGANDAKIMDAWASATVDDGDEIEVTFGARAQAQEAVNRKQLMDALTLLNSMVDPITGASLYDRAPLLEELFRSLDLGAPKVDNSALKQLQQMVLEMRQMLIEKTGEDPFDQPKGGDPASNGSSGQDAGGVRPSEGDGPSEENLSGGVTRGTSQPSPIGAG